MTRLVENQTPNETENETLLKPSRPRRLALRKPEVPPPISLRVKDVKAELCGVPHPYPRSLRARIIALVGCRVIVTALPKPQPPDAPPRDTKLPSFCRFETFFVSVDIKDVAEGDERIMRIHRYDELPRLLSEAAPEGVTLRVYMPTRFQHPKERGEPFMWKIPLVCVLGIRPVEDDDATLRRSDYLQNKRIAARQSEVLRRAARQRRGEHSMSATCSGIVAGTPKNKVLRGSRPRKAIEGKAI